MKTMVALLGGLPLIVSASAAYAQSIDDSQVNQPQQEQQQEAQPLPQPPPPGVSGDGQWVYVDGEGYVWIPADANPYVVQDVPYVYLYTPSVGWGWAVSPWGFGRYYAGGWVHHPWWAGHGGGYWPRYGSAPHGYYGSPHGAYGPHYGPRVYGPGVQHGGFAHPGGFVHPGGGFHHGGRH